MRKGTLNGGSIKPLILIALCLCLIGCTTAGQNLIGLSNFSWVVPNELARSAQPTPAGYATLGDMGIKAIVNLWDYDDWDAVSDNHMTPYAIPIDYDNPPSVEEIKAIIARLQEPWNQPALVHCQRGADRTGLIIASYRMIVQGWTYERALAEMLSYIPEHVEVWPEIRKRLKEVADAAK
jgi:protein tyrosine/serine phosphatase